MFRQGPAHSSKMIENEQNHWECAFPDTRISQSARAAPKVARIRDQIDEQIDEQKIPKFERVFMTAGLSARDRYPTWWFFSNISTKFLWFQTLPFGMYTTTLAAVREKARANPAKLSLPNLRFPGAPFLEESTGVRGRRSSSNCGPSF